MEEPISDESKGGSTQRAARPLPLSQQPTIDALRNPHPSSFRCDAEDAEKAQ